MSLKIFIFLSFSLFLPTAWGCATCAAGDPTLNLMGMERGFQGRLRFGLEYLRRTEDIGVAGFNQTQLTEKKTIFNLAYAFNPNLTLAARIPWVDKQLQYVNLAQQSNQALGDIEFTGKYTLSVDAAHIHYLGLIAGLRMPTASQQTDSKGKNLDIDVQAGTGAWTPQLGVWYGRYEYPYFLYASGTAHYSTEGFDDFQAGTAFTSTLSGQYALTQQLTAQLAIDSRWSAKNKFGDQSDENSGGFIAFLSPKIIAMPLMDLVLHLGVQIPVLKQLNGEQKEGVIWQLGITYDF